MTTHPQSDTVDIFFIAFANRIHRKEIMILTERKRVFHVSTVYLFPCGLHIIVWLRFITIFFYFLKYRFYLIVLFA